MPPITGAGGRSTNMKLTLLLLAAFSCFGMARSSVCASGCTTTDLQTAINNAASYQDSTACEDYFVTLAAGEVFSGNYTLPSKTCSRYITLESSLARNVAANRRAGPGDAPSMAMVRTPNTQPAIYTASSKYWRFRMLEVTKAKTGALLYPLVSIGNKGANQQSALPHHFI